jgi:hypothetical protein
MKNFAYVTTNFTGRKFMCISLEENPNSIELWSTAFSIGSVYYELKMDSDGNNLTVKDLDVNAVLLMDENKNSIYVDREQFVEVEGMHKIINNMWIGLN